MSLEIRQPKSGGKAGKGKNVTSSLQVIKRDANGFRILKQFRYKVADRNSWKKAREKALVFIQENRIDRERIDRINKRLEAAGLGVRLNYDLRNNSAVFTNDYQGDTDFSSYYLGDRSLQDWELRGLTNVLHDENLRAGFPGQYISQGIGFLFIYSTPESKSLTISEKLSVSWETGRPTPKGKLEPPTLLLPD